MSTSNIEQHNGISYNQVNQNSLPKTNVHTSIYSNNQVEDFLNSPLHKLSQGLHKQIQDSEKAHSIVNIHNTPN